MLTTEKTTAPVEPVTPVPPEAPAVQPRPQQVNLSEQFEKLERALRDQLKPMEETMALQGNVMRGTGNTISHFNEQIEQMSEMNLRATWAVLSGERGHLKELRDAQQKLFDSQANKLSEMQKAYGKASIPLASAREKFDRASDPKGLNEEGKPLSDSERVALMNEAFAELKQAAGAATAVASSGQVSNANVLIQDADSKKAAAQFNADIESSITFLNRAETVIVVTEKTAKGAAIVTFVVGTGGTGAAILGATGVATLGSGIGNAVEAERNVAYGNKTREQAWGDAATETLHEGVEHLITAGTAGVAPRVMAPLTRVGPGGAAPLLSATGVTAYMGAGAVRGATRFTLNTTWNLAQAGYDVATLDQGRLTPLSAEARQQAVERIFRERGLEGRSLLLEGALTVGGDTLGSGLGGKMGEARRAATTLVGKGFAVGLEGGGDYLIGTAQTQTRAWATGREVTFDDRLRDVSSTVVSSTFGNAISAKAAKDQASSEHSGPRARGVSAAGPQPGASDVEMAPPPPVIAPPGRVDAAHAGAPKPHVAPPRPATPKVEVEATSGRTARVDAAQDGAPRGPHVPPRTQPVPVAAAAPTQRAAAASVVPPAATPQSESSVTAPRPSGSAGAAGPGPEAPRATARVEPVSAAGGESRTSRVSASAAPAGVRRFGEGLVEPEAPPPPAPEPQRVAPSGERPAGPRKFGAGILPEGESEAPPAPEPRRASPNENRGATREAGTAEAPPVAPSAPTPVPPEGETRTRVVTESSSASGEGQQTTKGVATTASTSEEPAGEIKPVATGRAGAALVGARMDHDQAWQVLDRMNDLADIGRTRGTKSQEYAAAERKLNEVLLEVTGQRRLTDAVRERAFADASKLVPGHPVLHRLSPAAQGDLRGERSAANIGATGTQEPAAVRSNPAPRAGGQASETVQEPSVARKPDPQAAPNAERPSGEAAPKPAPQPQQQDPKRAAGNETPAEEASGGPGAKKPEPTKAAGKAGAGAAPFVQKPEAKVLLDQLETVARDNEATAGGRGPKLDTRRAAVDVSYATDEHSIKAGSSEEPTLKALGKRASTEADRIRALRDAAEHHPDHPYFKRLTRQARRELGLDRGEPAAKEKTGGQEATAASKGDTGSGETAKKAGSGPETEGTAAGAKAVGDDPEKGKAGNPDPKSGDGKKKDAGAEPPVTEAERAARAKAEADQKAAKTKSEGDPAKKAAGDDPAKGGKKAEEGAGAAAAKTPGAKLKAADVIHTIPEDPVKAPAGGIKTKEQAEAWLDGMQRQLGEDSVKAGTDPTRLKEQLGFEARDPARRLNRDDFETPRDYEMAKGAWAQARRPALQGLHEEFDANYEAAAKLAPEHALSKAHPAVKRADATQWVDDVSKMVDPKRLARCKTPEQLREALEAERKDPFARTPAPEGMQGDDLLHEAQARRAPIDRALKEFDSMIAQAREHAADHPVMQQFNRPVVRVWRALNTPLRPPRVITGTAATTARVAPLLALGVVPFVVSNHNFGEPGAAQPAGGPAPGDGNDTGASAPGAQPASAASAPEPAPAPPVYIDFTEALLRSIEKDTGVRIEPPPIVFPPAPAGAPPAAPSAAPPAAGAPSGEGPSASINPLEGRFRASEEENLDA